MVKGGALSAQKAIQGSETKKDAGRDGMEENIILLNEGFLSKSKDDKFVLVAIPGIELKPGVHPRLAEVAVQGKSPG